MPKEYVTKEELEEEKEKRCSEDAVAIAIACFISIALTLFIVGAYFYNNPQSLTDQLEAEDDQPYYDPDNYTEFKQWGNCSNADKYFLVFESENLTFYVTENNELIYGEIPNTARRRCIWKQWILKKETEFKDDESVFFVEITNQTHNLIDNQSFFLTIERLNCTCDEIIHYETDDGICIGGTNRCWKCWEFCMDRDYWREFAEVIKEVRP